MKILTLSVLLLLGSCNDRHEKVATPNVLLSEPQMVEIMTDVYVLENAINYRRGKSMSTDNLKNKGYEALFDHYGITDSIFFDNMDFYNEDVVVMKRILDSVSANIQRIKENINCQ